jgi:sugar diacid utilization regulator
VTKLEAEIIVALAENQLRTTNASRKLYMHRTTVLYHVKEIQKATGKNPLDFYGMCELLPKARQIITGEVSVTDQTRYALLSVGRKSHGESDA